MSDKLNIALLLGGTSAERNVSMATGKGVATALRENGHTVRIFDTARGAEGEIALDDLVLPTENAPTPEELAALDHRKVVECIASLPSDTDVVFLALHGNDGEDGKIQALLELWGLPYTGSGLLASAIAMDKSKTKELLELEDISVARSFLVRRDDEISTDILDRLVTRTTDYPVVIKPNDGGSTVGLTIVEEAGELLEAIERARRYGENVLCEEFIDGRELTVTVLGEETMPIVEIRPKSGMYDYANKYTAGRTDYFCPAELPEGVTEELQTQALRAHKRIGCTGYSRVDFRLSEHDEPYCLEINTLPGMTATSLVPKAAAAANISYGEVCERIVRAATERWRK